MVDAINAVKPAWRMVMQNVCVCVSLHSQAVTRLHNGQSSTCISLREQQQAKEGIGLITPPPPAPLGPLGRALLYSNSTRNRIDSLVGCIQDLSKWDADSYFVTI